jgi:hypothetical protein
MLGLVPLAALRTLMIDPALPSWIPELILRDLRVGDAKTTLRFWRDDSGASKWQILHQQGKLHIVRQAAPESLSASWAGRLAGIVESVS